MAEGIAFRELLGVRDESLSAADKWLGQIGGANGHWSNQGKALEEEPISASQLFVEKLRDLAANDHTNCHVENGPSDDATSE